METGAQILARYHAAREFEVTIGAATFRLRLPTPFDERRCALALNRKDGELDEGAGAQWMRDLTAIALVGWQGVTVGDLLQDGDAAALPFSREMAAALISRRIDILDELTPAFARVRDERRSKLEGDAKNSASASNGS